MKKRETLTKEERRLVKSMPKTMYATDSIANGDTSANDAAYPVAGHSPDAIYNEDLDGQLIAVYELKGWVRGFSGAITTEPVVV
jgi:hypothetical protein